MVCNALKFEQDIFEATSEEEANEILAITEKEGYYAWIE
jgi:hypothetical protein